MIKFYYLVVVHEFCINNLSATYVSNVVGWILIITLLHRMGLLSVCDYYSGGIKLY